MSTCRRRNEDRNQNHSENSKIIGSIVFLSVEFIQLILMLGFRSFSTKKFMRAGKINF